MWRVSRHSSLHFPMLSVSASSRNADCYLFLPVLLGQLKVAGQLLYFTNVELCLKNLLDSFVLLRKYLLKNKIGRILVLQFLLILSFRLTFPRLELKTRQESLQTLLGSECVVASYARLAIIHWVCEMTSTELSSQSHRRVFQSSQYLTQKQAARRENEQDSSHLSSESLCCSWLLLLNFDDETIETV